MTSLPFSLGQLAGTAAIALCALANPASADTTRQDETASVELVMVEQAGCVYCERWHAEIGPAYPNTAEGAFAPPAPRTAARDPR